MLFNPTVSDAKNICDSIKDDYQNYLCELGIMIDLIEIAKLCESPIESILFWKLVSSFNLTVICPYPGPNHKIDKNEFVFALESDTNDTGTAISPPCLGGLVDNISLFVQDTVAIGNRTYRPDFLMLPFSEKNYNIPNFIIEVDGHDFHEKTKIQAYRDKIRDRDFIKEGYIVLHFTGSEVWNNPDKVINEIIDQIIAKARG